MKKFKIAFIGAGSVGFTRRLLSDLLAVPEFHDIEVAFTDINKHNLDMVYKLCQRDIDLNGLNIKITATTDRREAFRGAKYVVNAVRIGALEAFETDIDIALRYGIDQCVGDTLCAGGIMYGQRGIPAILGFCKDIREVALPGCIMLNYANPNAMITWACNKYGGVKTIGLCHGVQGGHWQIANAFGLEQSDLDIICAGLNHQTWYISLKHNGEELTDKLLEIYENNKDLSEKEKVRIDILRHFGYYSTESNGHLSEYVSWYRKRPEEIKDWISLDSWILGETGGYLRVCQEGRSWFDTDFPNWMQSEPNRFTQEERSNEHGSYIIEGLETGRIYRGHFNVMNEGCITNLPAECVVEVPAYADANGISVPIIGELPLGCAAICSQSAWVQRIAVEAAVRGDVKLLVQAMLLDPLTGAVCNTREITQMVDEYLVEQAKWLPQYADSVEAAQKRLDTARLDGTFIDNKRDYKGAALIKRKTVEEMTTEAEKARKNASNADKA